MKTKKPPTRSQEIAGAAGELAALVDVMLSQARLGMIDRRCHAEWQRIRDRAVGRICATPENGK